MIREARPIDLSEIAKIYDNIHAAEESGKMTTGWISGVYPTKFGEIKVEAATLPNGKVKTTVTAPDGMIVKTDGVIIKNV